MKIALIEKMIQSLTGKKVKFYGLKKIELRGVEEHCINLPGEAAQQTQQRQGWSLRYDFHESCSEQEKVSFSAGGIIKTADGRELTFSLRLNMSGNLYRSKTLVSGRGMPLHLTRL